MATTTTAKTTRITMRNGFEGALISIDHDIRDLPEFVTDAGGKPVAVNMVAGDVWMVTVVGLYSTSRGDQVGMVKEHSFSDHAEARAYANRWFASLVRKGYRRTV